jgi:mono/diheme cytochrome c family protein
MDCVRATVANILKAGCSLTAGVVLGAAIAAVQATGAQDGFFSVEQAKHGESVVQNKCGACHGNDLDGGQEAPALRGDPFWSEWDQQTARKLYSRIISTMPPDSPGSLTEREVIDIVAFIVHENGLPAGTKAIESANELNSIKLQRPK